MANPLCLSPLKFYDALEKQERFKSYAYGHISPLIAKANFIPAFQLVVPGAQAIISASLVSLQDNSSINVLTSMQPDTYIDDSVIQYLGSFSAFPVTIEGEYYMVLNVSYQELGETKSLTLFSEVMCFTNSLDDYIELIYFNPENDFRLKGGKITFINNFQFKIYIKTELGKPEYTFEEETTERFGYSFMESQVSKKTYKFNAILPEYICDALRIVRLCSNKKIICKGEEYEALTFNMEVNWQEQGDLASVDCEFDVDNIIVNLGGFEQVIPGQDYNDDYENDFFNPIN